MLLTRAGFSDPEEVPPANTPQEPSKYRKIFIEDVPNPEHENTAGLAIFPDELLLEILSYYPESELDLKMNSEYSKEAAEAQLERRERLIALSQTCRNLRWFLRPYVWRRIEVFTGMRMSAGEVLDAEKQLALELVRQLEIVTIRDPDLARYIK